MDITIKEINQNYPLSLLLSADPDIKKIEKYLNKGRCFGAFHNDVVVGEYVLKDKKDGSAEIMNIAVEERYQKQGIAKILLTDAIARTAKDGFNTLEIATGKDSFQERLYASVGFFVYETDEGYFTREYQEKIIEDGVELTDLVRMRLKL